VHEDDVEGNIEDGQMLDPHGMDPQTVLRFVKYTGGWPGSVHVVACEPEIVEDVGFGLSDAVAAAVALGSATAALALYAFLILFFWLPGRSEAGVLSGPSLSGPSVSGPSS